jgi:membrane protein implicated in regulation of membrane protease activity
MIGLSLLFLSSVSAGGFAEGTTNFVTNITNNVLFVSYSSGLEYWVWASIGTVLFIVEIFAPGFVAFWFGLSAIFVSILSLFLLKTLESQVIAWILLSALLVGSFFYWKSKNKKETKSEDPIFKYVGSRGEIIQEIRGKRIGRVRLDNPINGVFEWNAIGENEDTVIEIGERVIVVGIDGIKLVVRRI